MIATSVLLLGVFVLPLWVISLEAPQYPQGLGIDIHIDRIEGESPHDLQNINGLNHYIGMHKIEPDSIQELKYMKYFAAGLALTALLVAMSRRRVALLVWVILAVSLSGIGMYDFYQWEYRYGHELDETAAIKVPGMSYQPPMFGTKQMLNFRTTAWPGLGGWMAMLGVSLAVASVVYEYGFRRAPGKTACACNCSSGKSHRHAARVATLLVLAVSGVVASGCTRRPEALAFGDDACAYCSMTISDRRHGALFVSDKGRTYKFDAVECMVDAMAPGEKFAGTTVHSSYVVDYARPGTVVDAATAVYLVSAAVPSPMGANVSAFGADAAADSVRSAKGGDLMNWDAVRQHLIKRAES